MIITKLTGGLGNQMFQYALGRHLAHIHNTDLKLDLSSYDKQQNGAIREYSLGIFNIKGNAATENEIKKFKKYQWKNGRRHFFYNLLFADKSIYIKEREVYSFDKEILKKSDNIYLDGHWQNEKYFEDIKNIIYKKFTLKNKFQIKNNRLKEKIENTNSVSLHFRRSDYAHDKKTNAIHGLCSLDYYQQAVRNIAGKNDNPRIFIFSDDIGWVKHHLKLNPPITFVEGNKDYEDLILMSLCEHNIIANSSFSWWGAWLNKNPNKIIIAPKKWFNKDTINTKDLIPKNWLTI